MDNYIINNETLAIVPYLLHYSIIYELNRIKIIKKKPINIINYNCRLHGSSYQGRLDGSYSLLGTYYKCPIVIDNILVLFPTSSPRLNTCSWINYYNVINIKNNKVHKYSVINFINNKSINLNVSCNVLNNQLNKSTILAAKILRNMGQKV